MSSLCEMIFCNCTPAPRRWKLLLSHSHREYNTQTPFLDVMMCPFQTVTNLGDYRFFCCYRCCVRIRRNESSSSLSNYVHYDFLQTKLKSLEEENLKLRTVVSLRITSSSACIFSELVWIVSLSYTLWAKRLDTAVFFLFFFKRFFGIMQCL